jgi:hypothetical protein
MDFVQGSPWVFAPINDIDGTVYTDFNPDYPRHRSAWGSGIKKNPVAASHRLLWQAAGFCYSCFMSEPTENLVVEILRRIQADIADLKNGQRGIREELIGLRNQLHIMQGDALRQEQGIAALAVDVDRIKSRLDLVDA